MLFACVVIWPNEELPNEELAGAAHCTMLNRFSTSMRTTAEVRSLVLICLLTPRSTSFRQGDSTPGSIRGALPNWLAAAVANAALFRYRLSVTFALIRSVTSPDTRNGCPATMFGRGVP